MSPCGWKRHDGSAGDSAAAGRTHQQEIDDEALRAELLELVETVIIYKLPRLTREEIQVMLHVHDIRETRVFQDAMEEGAQKERQRQLEAKLQAIAKMAALKIAPDDIAAILQLDIDVVRAELATLAR
jgi:predicted transposase YdaD